MYSHDTTDITDRQAAQEISGARVLARAYAERKLRAVATGLVNDAISFRGDYLPRARVKIYPNGTHVKSTTSADPLPPAGCVRGEIMGFSDKSRRRLQIKLSQMDFRVPTLLVTLTWHYDWGEWESWKIAYRAWKKRLDRRWGWLVRGGVWRLEFQRRGAPHYHLLLFLSEDISASMLRLFREWVSRSWSDVLYHGRDAAHLAAGTNVRKTYNTEPARVGALMRYLCKYLAKVGSEDEMGRKGQKTGRMWGTFGDVPLATVATIEVDEAAYQEMLERIRAYGEERGSRYLSSMSERQNGFLVFCDWCEFFDIILDGIPYVEVA